MSELCNVSFFIQIQNEELAQSLGLSTGQYMIKQSANKSTTSPQRPKKRPRKSAKDKQSATGTENGSVNAGETGNLGVDNSVMQASDLDELIDTQRLIEFAITSANPKDNIADFEPGQMLQSAYLEGPVIKIEEYPGSVPGISDGTSSVEDDALLCYMAQSSESADAVSDGTDQNLLFKQSLMQSTACPTQSSTLTFPLTLTVDGSVLDSCSTLQFS